MTARAGLERLVTEWLHADATVSGSDRVLSAALDRVARVGQARRWPTWRLAERSTFAKLAMAAAAVVVAALVGLDRLPGDGPRGGGASGSPSPTTSPTRGPSPPPAPSPRSWVALSSAEELAVGIGYSTDVGLAFDVPASRWFNSFSSISKASSAATDPGERPLATISFGTNVPDGVYADLCGRVRRDPIGRSTETDAAEDRRQHSADLATALASIPGTELLAGPSEVTVGGLRAQHVAIQVPEDVGCGPYLWYDWDRPSRSPAPGDTIRIWIVDYPHLRMRFWIEAETPRDADPALDQEIQQIIDSIEVIIG